MENLLIQDDSHEDELVWQEYKYYVYDGGASNDILCPKSNLSELTEQISAGEAETKLRDDGSYRYSNESINGNDRSSGPGERLRDKIKEEIERRVAAEGSVWKERLKRYVEAMELVVDMIGSGAGGGRKLLT